MSCNSCQKGKRCERQWRDVLRERGYHARRGRQYSGSPDSPDVVCEELRSLHFEVKCVEKLNIRDAMDQAKRDCGPGQVPVVAHHRNNSEWLVTMRADDWMTLVAECLPPSHPSGEEKPLPGISEHYIENYK